MNIPESKSTKMPWEFPRHWSAALVGASLRVNLCTLAQYDAIALSPGG